VRKHFYDFAMEKQFSYEGLSVDASVRHLAKFASDIWQIHPFCEGNTRATAVFMIKYMKTFGFRVKNRYMHVDYTDENDSQSINSKTPKAQFDTLECTLEELEVLGLVAKNPSIKQKELANAIGKFVATVKRIMKSLQDKKYIHRESGKRYGKWEVLVRTKQY